jgi:hypothetical protein
MTLIWFAVWLICDLVGDREPITFDPVNWWAGSLLLVIALDLARQHAPPPAGRRKTLNRRRNRPGTGSPTGSSSVPTSGPGGPSSPGSSSNDS